MKTKKKRVFSSKISTNSGYRLKIRAIFHEFLNEDEKKRASSQKFYEIRCESTKIAKIRTVNTNLGVSGIDLHSNSPEPVNSFGAQSWLGGAQFSFGGAQAVTWGGTAPGCPPVAPGLNCPLLPTAYVLVQSEHLEGGSGKIKILYLKPKGQLQPATVRCRIA